MELALRCTRGTDRVREGALEAEGLEFPAANVLEPRACSGGDCVLRAGLQVRQQQGLGEVGADAHQGHAGTVLVA